MATTEHEKPAGNDRTRILKRDIDTCYTETIENIRNSFVFSAIMAKFHDDRTTSDHPFLHTVIDRLKTWISADNQCVVVLGSVLGDNAKLTHSLRQILTTTERHPQKFYDWFENHSPTPKFHEQAYTQTALHLAAFNRHYNSRDIPILPLPQQVEVPSVQSIDTQYERFMDSIAFSVVEMYAEHQLSDLLNKSDEIIQ